MSSGRLQRVLLHHLSLIAFALCGIASTGAAATVTCNPLNQPGYISVEPASPDSTQQVTISVNAYSYDPKSVSVQVQSNTINVTLTANLIGFLAPPPTCLTSSVGPLAPGIYNVNLILVDPSAPNQPPVTLTSTTFAVSSPPAVSSLPGALSGLWWNSAESGWGIYIAQRESIVFAAWFTYDSAGKPIWYVAPDCSMPGSGASGSCAGALYEVNGPTFFGVAFEPSKAQVSAAGSLSLSFTDANTGSMTYSVAGQSRTVPIAREALASGPTPPPINYTDLWWNPDESGWGVAITHQFGVMFLAWYVYDGAGNPVWYVASNCALSTSQDGCTGTLYRTTGPVFGSAFDSSNVHVFVAGTVSVSFSNSNNGTLSYTVNGVSSLKSITRQLF